MGRAPMSRVPILLILGGFVCVGAAGYFSSSGIRALPRRLPQLLVPINVPLGEVRPWADLSVNVPVRNAGLAPLVIQDVYSCCNSKAHVENRTVAPGDRTTLHIEYHSTSGVGRPVRVDVILKTNDPKRPLQTIELSGHTPFGACALPSNICLGDVRRGEIREGELLVVTPGYTGPLDIVEMTSSVDGLELEVQTPQTDTRPAGIDGSFKMVKYRYNGPGEIGEVTGNIHLRLNTRVARELDVPFHASLVPTVSLFPKVLVVTASDDGAGDTPRLTGRVFVEAPAPIQDVRLKGGSGMLSVRWEGAEGATSGYLVVEIQPGMTGGNASGVAVVDVDHGGKTEQVRLAWRVLALGRMR